MDKTANRNISFANSDRPLTSKRVRIILSNPKDSKSLATSIRAQRHGKEASFKISTESQELINDKK